MASEVTNYQCPACTAPLRFDGESGKLVCDFCGSSYSVEEVEALYAEKDKAAAEASRAAEKAKTPEETDWVEEGLRAYVCPGCGAELICEQTTAATSCPYCGNPTVVPGQLTGARKPELVLPFRMKKEDAVAALHRHYGKHNYYLPRQFRAENHVQEVQGVYVPFWLFDAEMEGTGSYEGSDSHMHRDGDYEVTTSLHYDVMRQGIIRFEKIPADGSKKMRDDYMDALEPFDYADLKPFSTAYLPGYLADRFDVSAEECAPRVEKRCSDTLECLLRQDVNHSVVTTKSFRGDMKEKQAHYALLPVWMLTTKWRDQTYLFAMNGQTGKFVGELPTAPALFWRNVGLLTLILTLFLRFTGITRFLLECFGG